MHSSKIGRSTDENTVDIGNNLDKIDKIRTLCRESSSQVPPLELHALYWRLLYVFLAFLESDANDRD